MPEIKIVNILLICFVSLTGCVTLNSVKRDLQDINYSDGINQKEAIAIARMSMINSKLHGHYQLWACNVYDFLGYWKVVFLSLYLDTHASVLVITKTDGDLLAFFEAQTEEEAATGSNPVWFVGDWKRARKFD